MITFYVLERWSITYNWWDDVKIISTKEDAEKTLSLVKKDHPKEAFRIKKQTRVLNYPE